MKAFSYHFWTQFTQNDVQKLHRFFMISTVSISCFRRLEAVDWEKTFVAGNDSNFFFFFLEKAFCSNSFISYIFFPSFFSQGFGPSPLLFFFFSLFAFHLLFFG